MPSTLSGHLIEQHYTFHQSRAPFGQPLHASQLSTCGPMSFAPQMHGSFPSHPPFLDQSMTSMNTSSLSAPPSFMDVSEATAQKIATLQAKLDKKLGPEYISQRPGPGGAPKLTYAEGWKIINLANEVFGFNGWSSSVVNLNTDFIDYNEETHRFTVGVSAVMRITLRDGVYHEDVGYGVLENSRSKGAALDKCKKEAVTDGVKRALRNFGNLLGNCLYDKAYTQEVIKIKVPPAKFDKSTLHRRPEFDDSNTTLNQPNASTSNASSALTHPVSKAAAPPVIPKALGTNSYSSASSSTTNDCKPISAVPPHMRPNATSTPVRGNVPPQAQIPLKNAPAQIPVRKTGLGVTTPPQAPNVRNAVTPPPVLPNQMRQVNHPQPANPAAPPPPVHQQRAAPVLPAVPVQQQPRPQHVSMQEIDRQDTYSFNSDDDEFLAALDLCEGEGGYNEMAADIGRPIGSEEGIGSAIDFDEGARTNEEAAQDGLMTSSGPKTVSDGAPCNAGGHQGLQQQNQNHVRFAAPKAANNNSAQGGATAAQRQHLQRPLPQCGAAVSVVGLPNSSTEADLDDDIGKQIAVMRQQRNAMRNANLVPQRRTDENAASNANILPPSSKPRTPSMGGFKFPVGVNPNALPPSTVRQQQQGASAQAGMKRNMDAMTTSSTGRGPGMGLAQAQGQAGGQPHPVRQPLATLVQDLGNDPKRIRR